MQTPDLTDATLSAVLTPDAPDADPDADAPNYAPPSPAIVAGLLRSLTPHKRRAGYTKNHGTGTPKAKRSMARQSRRTNRGK